MKNNYLSQKTINYMNKEYGDLFATWFSSIQPYLDELFLKWNVTPCAIECNSKFGSIIYAMQYEKKVVIKIIPHFVERLYTEIKCYQILKYSHMCKLIDYDLEVGALLLEYHEPTNVKNELSIIRMLFEKIKLEKTPETNMFPNYFDVFINLTTDLLKRNDIIERHDFLQLKKSIDEAKLAINSLLDDKKYLLHGDLHIHNIILSSEPVMIDPIGYCAPFCFEYSRFIGTYFKNCNFDCKKTMECISEIVPTSECIDRIILATCIDVTLRACNTFVEGNTEEEITEAIVWAEKMWDFKSIFYNN